MHLPGTTTQCFCSQKRTDGRTIARCVIKLERKEFRLVFTFLLFYFFACNLEFWLQMFIATSSCWTFIGGNESKKNIYCKVVVFVKRIYYLLLLQSYQKHLSKPNCIFTTVASAVNFFFLLQLSLVLRSFRFLNSISSREAVPRV